MQGDQMFCNGKPETGSCFSGGEKWIKNFLTQIMADPRAGICYRYFIDILICSAPAYYPDTAVPIHGLSGIGTDVHDNLMELRRVCHDRAAVSRAT